MISSGIKLTVVLLTTFIVLFITFSSSFVSFISDQKITITNTMRDKLEEFFPDMKNVDEASKRYEGLLKCQEIRIKRLDERCKALGLHRNRTLENYSEEELQGMTSKFLSDDVNRVVIKALPKTGCTSWKSLVINNTMAFKPWHRSNPGAHSWGSIQTVAGLYTLSNFKKEALLNRLFNYFIILTVRHPLLRLESAFRDKKLRNYKLEIAKDPEKFYNVTLVNEFQKWIDVLSRGSHGNRHWQTYMNHAHPCIIPFNYIAKTETANPEMEYIVREKLKGIGGPVQKNRSNKLESEHDTPPKLKLLELFSRLKDPEATVKALMTEYGNDMKLFGYDFKFHGGKVYASCESYEFDGMCC